MRLLQRSAGLVAVASPAVPPPRELRDKILRAIERHQTPVRPATQSIPSTLPGLHFLTAAEQGGWKPLPVAGAWIKLLSLEREAGYAVLLGKLDPGTRYPAHINTGPEDLYIVTGDLHVGERRLGPGDFHHADAGSEHGVNYSVEGCTLLAVIPASHPLVQAALG